MGIFEFRKLVEAVILCVPLLLFFLFCLPFAINVNIIISAVFVVPIGGFAVMGVHDYSLLDFIRIYWKWRKGRRVLNFEKNYKNS